MSLDIVIPAHNEEARIGPTLAAYRSAFPNPDTRFLVALDRCSDGTAELVRRHAAEDPRVELHSYPKLGKGGVLIETFRRCRADLVGFVDADGATPPSEFARLIAATHRTDGAIASRRHPSSILPVPRDRSRRISSAGFAALVRILFGMPYRDTQCGAKVIRRPALERVLPLLSSRDLVFDVDLLLTATKLGFDIVEVPTVWIDRPGSRVDLGHDIRRMATSLLRLWIHQRVLPPEEAVPDTYVVIDLREDELAAVAGD